ncbi:Protein mlp1 [Basidiobolus ranarum]|uniref:Protein mlp1 n=1 Tax=Basidiobolus ranarum TaxID=34480 RepID=A0ABR2WTA3_9FUNG
MEPQEDTELIIALKQEVEDLKAQKVVAEVNFEHELHTSETKLLLYKKQLQNSRERVEKVEKTAVDTSTENVLLKSQLEKKNEEIQQYLTEIKELKAEIDALDSQKRDGLAALDARTLELTQNSGEYQELQDKLSITKKEVSRLENELQEARHAELSSKFKQQTVEQELLLLRQQNEWLTQELNTKTEEFGKYRREKTSQLSKLQNELDTAVDNEAVASQAASSAHRRFEEQTTKLEDAFAKIKELQNQLISEEENFKSEMATQIRLATLWEKSSNEAKERMSDLDEVISDLQRSLEEKNEEFEYTVKKYTEENDSLREELNSAESQLEKLQIELRRANEILGTTVDLSDTEQSRIRAGLLSPTAAIASRLQKSGKSFTEVYSEYASLQEQLVNEKRETSRLNECLQQILQDIEERAPILQEQRREYERVCLEAAEISNQLNTLIAESDEMNIKLEDAKLTSERFERENLSLRQENRDLGRQVQALLREVERSKGMSDSFFNSSSNNIDEDTDHLDTDSVISEQLTTFRSISELQQQNQRLLRITRELGERMEREEAERKESDIQQESEAVQEAHKLIEILRDELKLTRTKMESYLRERDMCRRLLAQGGHELPPKTESPSPLRNSDSTNTDISGPDYPKLLIEVQSEFDAYRKETDIDTKMLRDQIDAIQKEGSEYRIQLARANAQIDFLNERYQLLVDNTKLQATELQEARKRNSNLQESLGRQDSATQRLTQDLVEAKEALERMRTECSNLRAEKELSKSIEARLVHENEALSKERTHLNDLMRNLQNMQNEFERVEATTKRRFETQIQNLEEELRSTKQKLSEEIDSNKALNLRKENESKDYQIRLDKAISDHQQTRESLVAAETSMLHLNTKISELSKQLEAAQEKLALYQQKGENGQLSPEEKLEQEIVKLKAELSAATAESDQLRQHVEQYKAISKSNEDALAEINQTYDEYKAVTDKKIEENEKELSNLKETIVSLNDELRKAVTELTEGQEKMDTERATWEAEKKNYETKLIQLGEIEEKARIAQESFQEDLRRQAKMTEEAQENYERELLMHANDIQSLNKMKAQYQQLSSEIHTYQIQTETAEANLKSSEISWAGQKEILEKSIEELERRCQDLVAQNNILHSQFETVSAQALRIQKASGESAVVPEGETGSTSDKPLEELREVLRFLRREKDILQCQHELAIQESRRLKQQLEHANQSLDETRALLTEERRREQEAVQSATQHAELLEKINQLNILRESNVTLREENEKNIAKLQSLEKALKETTDRIDPLEEQIRNYQADLEAKDGEIKALEEDNQRWKTRTRQILQKYERIDPVEHQTLKDESERLKTEYTALAEEKNQLATELQETKEQSSKSIENLSKRITKLSEHCNLWKKRYEHVSAQTKEKLQQQAGQLAELAEAQKAVEELKEIKQQLEKVQLEKDKLQEERDSLTTQISSSSESEKTKFENMRKTALGYYHKLKQIEGEFKKLSEEKKSFEQEKTTAIEAAIKEKAQELEAEHVKALKETEMRSKIKLSLAEGQVKKLQAKLQTEDSTISTNSVSAPSTPIQNVDTLMVSESAPDTDNSKRTETTTEEPEPLKSSTIEKPVESEPVQAEQTPVEPVVVATPPTNPPASSTATSAPIPTIKMTTPVVTPISTPTVQSPRVAASKPSTPTQSPNVGNGATGAAPTPSQKETELQRRQALLKAKLQKQKLQRMKQQQQQQQNQQQRPTPQKLAVAQPQSDGPPVKRAKSSSPQLQKLRVEAPAFTPNLQPKGKTLGKGKEKESTTLPNSPKLVESRPTTPVHPAASNPGAVPMVSVNTETRQEIEELTEEGEVMETQTKVAEASIIEPVVVDVSEIKEEIAAPMIKVEESEEVEVSNELSKDIPVKQEVSESEPTPIVEEVVSQDENYSLEDPDLSKLESKPQVEVVIERVTSEPEVIEAMPETTGETEMTDMPGLGLKRIRENNDDTPVDQNESEAKKVKK